jgi:predicted ATPase
MHQKIVFTGGPGAGKSTVLAALEEHGYAVAADHARAIIQERSAGGLSPRPEPVVFAKEILRLDIEAYERASSV